MRVSKLTTDDDWRFGKGKAQYLQGSDAIRQNVKTRIRSFTDDWFADVAAGLPWVEMLGTLGEGQNKRRILREIERVVLTTEGVRAIDRLEFVSVDINRNATIRLTVIDMFDQRYDETVRLL